MEFVENLCLIYVEEVICSCSSTELILCQFVNENLGEEIE